MLKSTVAEIRGNIPVIRQTTKMLAITCFGIFVILHLAVGDSVQRPNVTRCNGTDFSQIRITKVTIRNARLGQTVTLDSQISVFSSFGSSPVLEASVSSAKGEPLRCAYTVVPKQQRLCNGQTDVERKFNAAWNNRCPIKPGVYNASVSAYAPDGLTARSCVGDGKLVATLKVKDEGYTFDCVSFPFTVDLN